MFEQYYSMYGSRIQKDAVRIAGGDLDFADDIAQEGLIALWQLSTDDSKSRYVYQAVVRHMLKYRRTELKAQVIAPVRRCYKRVK